MFQPVTLVAGLQNVAVMGQPVQQGRGHLLIAKYARPFAEAQIGRDHDAGALVKLADQVEKQGAAGLTERQVAQFIEYDQIGMDQSVGQPPCCPACFSCSSALTGSTVDRKRTRNR